jgi:hypothetical protein
MTRENELWTEYCKTFPAGNEKLYVDWLADRIAELEKALHDLISVQRPYMTIEQIRALEVLFPREEPKP